MTEYNLRLSGINRDNLGNAIKYDGKSDRCRHIVGQCAPFTLVGAVLGMTHLNSRT